jgi:predicted XRE-type DNA-binding protein
MADFVVGGKSVFRDIGFSSEEAEELEVKSSLITQISLAIEQRGMTQTEAATLIGTDQPSLSKILRGRMGAVSVERLTAWLIKLGYNVKLTVTAKLETDDRCHFSVDIHA